MEYWNIGMMIKEKGVNSFLPSIPIFHHSTIPVVNFIPV
jgi:hypothetical protein